MRKSVLHSIFMTAALLTGAIFTSCLSGSNEYTRTTGGSCTVSGNMASGYTFYLDGGGIIEPTTESITQLIGNNGITQKRGIFYFTYTNDDFVAVTGGKKIKNAKIYQGAYLYSYPIITTAQAADEHITDTDSLFEIGQFTDLWAYRGYINTSVTAYYSSNGSANIMPTVRLVYNPEEQDENVLNLSLCYNRHSTRQSTAAGSSTFVNTYPITDLASVVPGTADTIMVIVRALGSDPKSIRMPRKDFYATDYLPY